MSDESEIDICGEECDENCGVDGCGGGEWDVGVRGESSVRAGGFREVGFERKRRVDDYGIDVLVFGN